MSIRVDRPPHPQIPSPPPVAREEDGLDHAAAYAKEAEGVRNLSKVFSHAARYALLLPHLTEGQRKTAERVQQAGESIDGLLSIPYLISNINDFRHHVTALDDALHLPESDPHKAAKVQKALKKTTLSGFTIVNTGTEAAGVVHGLKWIDLGAAAPVVSGANSLTTLITDGAEGIDQIHKLQKYPHKIALAETPARRSYYEQKLQLAQCTLIKDAASVAMAIIGILSLIFGALITGIYVIVPIVLGLSTVYLAGSIIGFFYKKIIEEQKNNSKLFSLSPSHMKA